MTVVESLTIYPAFMRCSVSPKEIRLTSFSVASSQPCKVILAETKCRCVQVINQLPFSIAPGHPVTLQVKVIGVLPGIKTINLHTTIGNISANIQVVSAGLGLGADTVKRTLVAANRDQASVWFILKDFKGSIRNCGCSDGSLGGLDHLASLPDLCKSQAPTMETRFIYIGDTNGMRLNVASALDQHGWKEAGNDVILSDHPERDVQSQNVAVVIPTVPSTVNHAKIVSIPIDEGMVVMALTMVKGRIIKQELIPIDHSLPSYTNVLARFTSPLSVHVHENVDLGVSCASCHASASTAWHASAHAHAYASLAVADRTDACISCHSTSISKTDVVAGVQCQACHQNTEAHVASRGVKAMDGTISCQSCHDERRQPDFLRDPAWAQILHGK